MIYFILNVKTNSIKIGYTDNNIKSRMSSLQTDSSEKEWKEICEIIRQRFDHEWFEKRYGENYTEDDILDFAVKICKDDDWCDDGLNEPEDITFG